jgi:oxysterol-binding protein 1
VTKIAGSEHFSWKKVITSVNGLIVGKLWIVHYGDMVIKNWRTGEEAVVTFKQKESGGWFGIGGSKSTDPDDQPSDRDIVGTVKDKTGRVRFELKGRWDEKLVAHPVNPSSTLPTFLTKPFTIWSRQPPPTLSPQNFHFTNFAISLNEMSDALGQYLPPTDSRLRPDPRAMEKGEWSSADEQKNKIENCQRERRKKIVKEFETNGLKSGPPDLHNKGIDIGEAWWTPRWFVREIEPNTKEEHWRFTTEYWKHRGEVAKLREVGGVKSRGWPDWVLDVFNPVEQH